MIRSRKLTSLAATAVVAVAASVLLAPSAALVHRSSDAPVPLAKMRHDATPDPTKLA